MALYNLLLPKMGESVAEATIIKWNKAVGDRIEMDDTVMEIATDKVDSEVPSPVSGRLKERLCNENDVVQVGAVIAVIETGDKAEEASGTEYIEYEEIKTPQPIPGIDQLPRQTAPPVAPQQYQAPQPPQQQPAGIRFYSPLVKNIANQEGVTARELDAIPGTGAEGRLTKDDLLLYIKNRNALKQQQVLQPKPQPRPVPPPAQPVQQAAAPQRPAQPAPAPPPQRPVAQVPVPPQRPPQQAAPAPQAEQPKPQPKPAARPVSMSAGDEIIEMDRMRRLIADHMVSSVQTSPHVTSFVEADVTNMVFWRDKIKAEFEKREGIKITFTPMFIEAVARAIKDMPMINVSVDGTNIIKRKDINIGMATALPSGNLIVPVIRKADELNLFGLTKAVNDLAQRARTNRLQPDEVKDGTFTITNVGSFGNVMGTPIINQPQVAILAVGVIKKKPAVIETPDGDVIGIRHMMYLSLSYDHRVVDGALGGSFVRRVADYLEAWDIHRTV